MDSLFAINQGAFAQLATHISIYNQPMSEGYRGLVTDALRDTVGLWRWHKYTLWNVPGLGAMLGKVAPVDVHGFFVVVDEAEIAAPSRGMTYSTLRYTILTAGQRRKEGGRRLYEFTTMNFGLAVSGILGASWMRDGRTRFAFFDHRPVASIASAMGVSVVSFVAVRMAFKLCGVGMWVAEMSHATALKRVKCADCLDEMILFTDEQIEDVKHARLPDPKPGQPPTPPELHVKFKEAMVLQGELLRKDQFVMRDLQRKMLAAVGITAEQTQLSKRAAKLKRLGMTEEELKPRAPADKKVKDVKSPDQLIADADAAIDALIATPASAVSLVKRDVPDRCLCDVHRGLRIDPLSYEHPQGWPLFPKDREMALERNAARDAWRAATDTAAA
jgi:hypothetical protein